MNLYALRELFKVASHDAVPLVFFYQEEIYPLTNYVSADVWNNIVCENVTCIVL